MRMLKLSKIAVLLMMILGLILTACGSSQYPSRPSDVRKEIWEQVNETYVIVDENWKSIDLPSEYDMEIFFSFYDKYMEDVNELSKNEYDLIERTTNMIYYLSEYQGMFFTRDKDYTNEEKREMLIHYESAREDVSDILGIEIE